MCEDLCLESVGQRKYNGGRVLKNGCFILSLNNRFVEEYRYETEYKVGSTRGE